MLVSGMVYLISIDSTSVVFLHIWVCPEMVSFLVGKPMLVGYQHFRKSPHVSSSKMYFILLRVKRIWRENHLGCI